MVSSFRQNQRGSTFLQGTNDIIQNHLIALNVSRKALIDVLYARRGLVYLKRKGCLSNKKLVFKGLSSDLISGTDGISDRSQVEMKDRVVTIPPGWSCRQTR